MRCKIPSRDLNQKLNETICRYKGKAVYVRVDGLELYLYRLNETGKQFAVIKPDDKDLDVSGVPLGYVQHGKDVYYVTRIPMRRVKQGLDNRTLRFRNIQTRDLKAGSSKVGIIFTKEFADMIENNYPDLRSAISRIRKQYSENLKSNAAIAISRKIAMWINELGVINVYYMDDLVGYIQPDKNTVHVTSSDKSWIISKYLSHELSWEID